MTNFLTRLETELNKQLNAAGKGLKEMVASGQSVAREFKGIPDENAARAHNVVTARQLRKKIKNPETPPAERDKLSKQYYDLPGDVIKQVESEPMRQGRRKDIQEKFQADHDEWEKGDKKAPEPKQPLVVRLAIGGSGDAAWRTHCDINGILTDADLKKTKQTVGKEKTVHYTHGSGTKKYEWNFAGPGGPDASGMLAGGMSDSGPNSIENLVKNAGEVVEKAVKEALVNEQTKGRPIVIIIKGHSRGAVAAGHIANYLKKAFATADVKVEGTQIDPVPGPFQPAKNKEVDVATLDESTLVYSVYSGHGVSFTPQRVLGAKRIIISQQKHGVGVQNGFVFGDRLYTGNSLTSLKPGVYRDQNADISKSGVLEKVAEIAEVRNTFLEVYSRRYPQGIDDKPGKTGQNFDAQRKQNIEAVLKRFETDIKKAPADAWDEVVKETMDQLAGS